MELLAPTPNVIVTDPFPSPWRLFGSYDGHFLAPNLKPNIQKTIAVVNQNMEVFNQMPGKLNQSKEVLKEIPRKQAVIHQSTEVFNQITRKQNQW